jgi:hypothetical protein
MLFALRLWPKRQFLRAIQARLVKLPAKGLAKSGHWFIAQHSALWALPAPSLQPARTTCLGNTDFRCVVHELARCGLSELSPQVLQWPLLVGVSSKHPECIYAISSIMYVIKSRVPSTKAAAQ